MPFRIACKNLKCALISDPVYITLGVTEYSPFKLNATNPKGGAEGSISNTFTSKSKKEYVQCTMYIFTIYVRRT